MRIVFIGTVEFSRQALEKLINLNADIAGVITKQKSDFNSDFADVTNVCSRNSIPFKHVTDINLEENVSWIKSREPDIIFCFGWSQILKKVILKVPSMGVLGYHPAALPRNKGRHPIIWPLVLGLNKTGSTFFFMDEGIDSGDILSQVEIDIAYEDDAQTLYNKITKAALKQIEEFFLELCNKSYSRIPQDHSKATYWRKREKKDGYIDFRMSHRAIYNLVRGLTRPYPGAHVVFENEEIKVWQVKEVSFDLTNVEHGKILNVSNNGILVKCYDGAILLVKHGFTKLPESGEYLQ